MEGSSVIPTYGCMLTIQVMVLYNIQCNEARKRMCVSLADEACVCVSLADEACVCDCR